MKTLVVGASGATGEQSVEQLLNMGQNVKVIVRILNPVAPNYGTNIGIKIENNNQ